MLTRAANVSVPALVGVVLGWSIGCCPRAPEDLPSNPTRTLTAEEYGLFGGSSSEDVCSVCRGSAREAALIDAGYFSSEIEVDCSVTETADGGAVVDCQIGASCDAGRAPHALADAGWGAAGSWWARLAIREAEAVSAFEELARELQALGAPTALIERAEAARDDELRHARICARMAGVEPPVAPPIEPRNVEPVAFARLNASEGCVRETFAVIDTMARARATQEPAVRAALESIAKDELRHAQLSWDIHAWIQGGALGPDAAAAANEAKRRAAHHLLARANQSEADDCPAPLSRRVRRQLAERFLAHVAA